MIRRLLFVTFGKASQSEKERDEASNKRRRPPLWKRCGINVGSKRRKGTQRQPLRGRTRLCRAGENHGSTLPSRNGRRVVEGLQGHSRAGFPTEMLRDCRGYELFGPPHGC